MGWDGPLTHRQYLAWQTWLEAEWNAPDRHDHYLIRLTYLFARANAKDPARLDEDKFKLRFERRSAAAAAQGAQSVAENKAALMGHLRGLPGVVYTPPPGRE